MKHTCYSLPVKLGRVIQKKKLARCSLEESIRDHIHLMITSHFRENKYDQTFGNGIWEYEFSNMWKDHNIREDIKRSVLHCITRHEPRLEDLRIDIRWLQEEVTGRKIKRLNRLLDISITGIITVKKKPFIHNEQCYIAPLSYK